MNREGRNGCALWVGFGCCIVVGFAVTIGLSIATLVAANKCADNAVGVAGIAPVQGLKVGAGTALKPSQAVAGASALHPKRLNEAPSLSSVKASLKQAAVVEAEGENDEVPVLLEPKEKRNNAAPQKGVPSLAEQLRRRSGPTTL